MATINSGVKVNTPSACVIAAGTAAGSLSVGNYSYKVTFVTNFGETGASAASNVIAATLNSSMAVSSIPVWTDNNVIARKLYRTIAGGATYLLCATISDNTTTTYNDGLADGSLGAAVPAASTADSLQTVNGYISFQRPIQVSVTNGITALAGGGQTGATLLFSQSNVISTVGTAADSVILPLLNSNLIGLTMDVKNNGANSTNVFPASGQTINALAANTAYALASTANITFRAVTASNWQTFA